MTLMFHSSHAMQESKMYDHSSNVVPRFVRLVVSCCVVELVMTFLLGFVLVLLTRSSDRGDKPFTAQKALKLGARKYLAPGTWRLPASLRADS